MAIDLYQVTAGGDSLRAFKLDDKAGAIEYGHAVVRESHPNIGCVRVEARDEMTGDWSVVETLGIPGDPYHDGADLFSDGESWFDERHVCNRCRDVCKAEGKPYQWADEQYSFGHYAGRYCAACWPKSGYRDACDDSAEFDPSYAGESLDGDD